VGADAEANEEGAFELDFCCASRAAKGLAGVGYPHRNHVAALFDPEASGAFCVGLDFVSEFAFGFAGLEGGEAIAVEGGVGIGGIRVEGLADQQDGFAVAVAAGGFEFDVCGE